ncbi:MAG TPA: ADP-ribosylglycohydrolase family protein [Candidatus Izemoplasmatales bacterium]|nr:ADP-ribosylglycohydrolase family protein [Candidatus Izemoplasmatales bacterium]
MNQMIKSALLANHATIGVHWIYDHKYLETLSNKQPLLFLKQSKEIFDEAKTSFFVYENNDYSVQGDILLWLYESLKKDPNITPKLFAQILYGKFKPGGDYAGYAEKYSKKQVFNHLIKELRLDIEPVDMNDQQMVGFVPYIVFKALDKSSEDAMNFTKIYSNESFYFDCFSMLDRLFDLLEDMTLKKAIKMVIEMAPKQFQESLNKATEMDDTETFIDRYAGRACPVKQALPVVFHLLYHHPSYEEVIEANAVIGGASSDRALLLGAILSKVYGIPTKWENKM